MEHLGEAHVATVAARFSLTYVLGGQGRDDERNALLVRLLEVSRQTHGPDHPQTGYIRYFLRLSLDALGSLGRQQYDSGNYQGVLKTFGKSQEIREALFGRLAPSEVALSVMALHQLGRFEEAREQLEQLREMYEPVESPYDGAPLHRAEHLLAPAGSEVARAWGLIEAGELDEALAVVEQLTAVDASDKTRSAEDRQSLAKALAGAYCHRAAIAEVDCEYHTTERYLEAAVRACPDYGAPLQKLAWLRATCPVSEIRNADDAIALATRACELTQWQNAACIETLAAGCAAAGDFTAAVIWQERAIELLPAEAHAGHRAVSEKRLDLYRSQHSFRSGGTRCLVARWDFEDVVDRTVIDVSGNRHDGTLVGDASVVEDPDRGRVLHLDGTGHVDCGADPAFDLTGPVTVAAWIKMNASRRGARQPIVANGRVRWHLSMFQNTGRLRFVAMGLDVPEDRSPALEGNRQIDDALWHHVAGVYDGTRLRLYVDGELDASATAGGTIMVSDLPLIIGSAAGPAGGGRTNWTGWIDDVRIYDYGLSDAEIRALCLDGGVGAQGEIRGIGGEEEGAG
jgi:tetratricopeptide (TPR) repeat protein